MKLHVKLILSFLIGVVVVAGITQLWHYNKTIGHIADLSGSNMQLLKEREENFAKNIYRSAERAVAGSLERGEMDKFNRLLQEQREIEGLQEFSLYDRKGVVTHSSDASFLKKVLSEDIKKQIANNSDMHFEWMGDSLAIYKAQVVRNDCVRCHIGWVEGEVGGVTSLRLSTEALNKASKQAEEAISKVKTATLVTSVFSGAGIVLLLMVTGYIAIRRFVSLPLKKSVDMLRDIAEGEGNLTSRLEVGSQDEVGEMAKWFNSFVGKLQDIIKNVAEKVHELNVSSDQLTSISDGMASKADEMSKLSGDAAAATEQTADNIKNMAASVEEVSAQVASVVSSSQNVTDNMKEIGRATENVSNNLNGIATASEQMSSSVNMVASAIEQMYASLNEVAKNSGRGANMTNDASEKAEETSTIVNTLGEAAKEIGDVVDLINGIASQTNLLALNAAIEAAGAGDAGKGFAVVANEVKELAKQTSGATDEIRKKVEGMQANTQSAIEAIKSIVQVINEINSIMSTIATAVEEQTATTNEISKNIAETVGSANSVTENVQQAAQAATETSKNVKEAIQLEVEVSRNLSDVAQGATAIAKDAASASVGTDKVAENVMNVNKAVEDTSMGAGQVKKQAGDLADIAQKLQTIIGQFKV